MVSVQQRSVFFLRYFCKLEKSSSLKNAKGNGGRKKRIKSQNLTSDAYFLRLVKFVGNLQTMRKQSYGIFKVRLRLKKVMFTTLHITTPTYSIMVLQTLLPQKTLPPSSLLSNKTFALLFSTESLVQPPFSSDCWSLSDSQTQTTCWNFAISSLSHRPNWNSCQVGAGLINVAVQIQPITEIGVEL